MQWYYGVDGQQQGPVSAEQLKALIANGSLPPNALAWRDGLSEWQPVSGLSELAPPGPPAVPAGPGPPAVPRGPAPRQAARPAPAQRTPGKRPWSLSLLAIVWLIFGLFLTLGGAAGFAFVPPGPDAAAAKITLAAMAALGALLVLAGLGLWMLKGWGRILAIIFAVLALPGIPVGTVIGIVLLLYLASPGIRLLYSSKRVEDMDAGERGELVAAQTSGLGTALGVLLLLSAALPLLMGPIAAIAVPNLLNAIQRGKQKRTMGDIRAVATAVEQFAIDENAYPDVDGTVADLEEVLVPTYIQMLPTTDGWNNPMVYETYEDATGYWIGSYGKDGVSSGPEEGPTSNFNDDIFMATGVFVTYPEGTQT